MEYVKVRLNDTLKVSRLISVHYFEYYKDFAFAGERHDFWEFLYVDKGVVHVQAGKTVHTLQQGEIIFHQPNEFHNVIANGVVAPNLVVIAFDCHSRAMGWFRGKILRLTEEEKQIMASIVYEARRAFSSPLNDPYLSELKKQAGSPFGCEQLVRLYLELMLIQIVRGQWEEPKRLSTTIRRHSEDDLYERINDYIRQHLGENLTMEELCRAFSVSKTTLKLLYKQKQNCGVMEYYRQLKIEEAKWLIREKNMNFTAISDWLGFSSVHYFSRCFKKNVGMTPSEYAQSVKILSDYENPLI